MKVAVVGGGPSGLATLKHLKTAHLYFDIDPIDATLYEAEPSIGGTFVYRVYEDAELVSSKYLTAFSDFRFEPHKPDFVAPEDYVDYLESYALEFGLLPHIHCSTKVSRIRRKEDGQHLVTLLRQGVSTDKLFDAVAICSGLNVEPARPLVPGLYHTPTVLHSSEFHSRKQLLASRQDPTVVVMGIGETGMDLGHLAVTTPGVKSVIMCHHQGFFCAPKRVPEPTLLGFWSRCKRQPPKPIDASTASLFDTAYVHPYLQRGSLLWRYYTWSIRSLLFLATGTSRGYDQWVGGLSDERMNANGIFLCKSDRAMPYLSAPYRSGSLANRIRAAFCNMPIPNTCGRHIDLAPWPTHIDDDGFMHFEHTDRPESQKFQDVLLKPDVVLLATGYTQRFDFLDATYTTPQKANVRGVYHEDDVSVGFIGFVRPSIGAIPPLAELQAQLWVLRLVQSVSRQYGVAKADARLHSLDANALPPYELDYALHPRGNHDMYEEKLGVDHESYAYQLALDMGTAPTFTFMVRQGPTMLWTWAMGSNFNTKFRLVGPWKDRNRALAIMRGELYPVTKRFGGFVFFFLYTIVPFIAFGTLSMVLYAWDAIRGLFVGKREKARPSAT